MWFFFLLLLCWECKKIGLNKLYFYLLRIESENWIVFGIKIIEMGSVCENCVILWIFFSFIFIVLFLYIFVILMFMIWVCFLEMISCFKCFIVINKYLDVRECVLFVILKFIKWWVWIRFLMFDCLCLFEWCIVYV